MAVLSGLPFSALISSTLPRKSAKGMAMTTVSPKGQVTIPEEIRARYGEPVYIVERERGLGDADAVFAELTAAEPVDGRPPICWLPVDERLVRQAARIKARGGISYADSFAAASSQLLGCPVAACMEDEEFKVAEALGIQVRWIRRQ